jgi:hypothetical protein
VCRRLPSMLPKLLVCIDWAQSRQVAAALDLLSAVEAPPPPHVCVQLLDARFPHSAVRLFATHGGWALLPQSSFPGTTRPV